MMLAVVLAGAVAWLLASGSGVDRITDRARRGRLPRWSVALPGLLLVGASLALVGVGPTSLALGAAALLGVLVWLARRARLRRAAARTASGVARACQLMAAQLGVGRFPAQALAVAARDCPLLQAAAAQSELGGEVPASLREAGATPGAEGLIGLAAAWQLSLRTGSPLASAVRGVADRLADRERLHQEVGTELAASRATGKLLALLPVIAVAMAAAVGARPVHFLSQTLIGRVCTGLAGLLTAAGLVWTELLGTQAEQTGAGR